MSTNFKQNLNITGVVTATSFSGDGSALTGIGGGGGATTWANITDINNASGPSKIAVGIQAGLTSQGTQAVAIGAVAGRVSQGGSATAIGSLAGETSQGAHAVAIGSAASSDQGEKAIAIGFSAGDTDQGASSIAIGDEAGKTSQAINSIVLNATGSVLQNTQASSLVVKPVRNASGTHALEYNPTTGEITYDTLAGAGAALYGAESTGGVNPTASGTLSLAIGSSASATKTWATAVGKGASATATYSAAFGNGATAKATFAVALGGSVAAGDRSFAAVIDDTSGTYGAKGLGSIAIGKQATATGNNSVAIGKDAVATQDQITLGDSTATVKIPGLLVAGIFTLTASGSSHYVYAQDNKFFMGATNDPVLYLRRGDTYIFINNSGGGHPFQIRGSNGGSAYSFGVTNNGASSGEIIFTVPMGAPSTLYYQCTAHSAMGGVINIV